MQIRDIYFGTSEDLFRLRQTLDERLPMFAYMNPDYDWQLRTMLLAGKQPEAFRDRRHISLMQAPDFVTKVISSDRRQYTRHRVSPELEFVMLDGDAKIAPVSVLDISYGGLAFECERESTVSVGARLGVAEKPDVETDPEDYKFLVGTVMNVREKERKLIVGIAFLEEYIPQFSPEVERIIFFDRKEAKDDRGYRTAAA